MSNQANDDDETGRPVRTFFMLATATGVVFLCGMYLIPAARSITVGYRLNQIRAEEIDSVTFYCPRTERSLVICDPDRIQAVATMYQNLTGVSPEDVFNGGRDPERLPPMQSVINCWIWFQSGGFTEGYWTVYCDRSSDDLDPLRADYLPNATSRELDPGVRYLPQEIFEDEKTRAVIQNMLSIDKAAPKGE